MNSEATLETTSGQTALPSSSKAVALLLATAIPAVVWNPRGAAFAVPLLLVLTMLLLGRRQPRSASLLPRHAWIIATFALFLAYAGLASLWAPNPGFAAFKLGLAAALAAGTAIALQRLKAAGSAVRGRVVGLAWVGYTAAVVIALADVMTGQALKQQLLALFGIAPAQVLPPRFVTAGTSAGPAVVYAALSRHAAPIVLLLWPALLAASITFEAPYRRPILVAIGALAVATLVALPLETAKIALVAGLLAFALAQFRPRLAMSCAAAGWCLLCLGFPAMSVAAHRLDLQHAAWLPVSAQHRIIIWNDLSNRIIEAPMLGIGPEALYTTSTREAPRGPVTDPRFPHRVRHAHSFYLQTWIELGAVGVVLMALSGLAMLHGILSLDTHARPYAMAGFATASVLVASTFGTWQPWLLGTLALTLFLIAAAGSGLARAGSGDGFGRSIGMARSAS